MAFSLEAVFGVDTTGLKAGLKSARRDFNDFATDWRALLGLLGGTAIFTSLAKDAIALGGQLSDTAGNIGINVESLQALEAQHKRNGVSNEQLTKALEKTKAAVIAAAEGDDKATASLDKLGLKAAALIRLPLDQQYEAIAKAAASATDQNEAYSAVCAILGEKVGPKLFASLKELASDGLPAVVKAATEAGQVLSAETIVALDRAGDAIDDFKKKATVAVGEIIVNFRSEEGLKLLGLKLLQIASSFGGTILDAFGGAFNYFKSASGAAGVYIRERVQNALVSAVEAMATAINKVLPDKFQINIGNLEKFRVASEDFGEIIAREISQTSPTTFKKDFSDMWGKAVADQQKVVDQLNQVDLKPAADQLLAAGDAIATKLGKVVIPPPVIPPVKVDAAPLQAAVDDFNDGVYTWRDGIGHLNEIVNHLGSVIASVDIPRIGKSYEDQSTASLQGVRNRLNDQLNAKSPNSPSSVRNADINQDYGAYFSAQLLKSELATVEKILGERSQIQGYTARYGETAARTQFGDTAVDSALRDVQASSTRTATATEQIAASLKKLGIG